MSIKIRNPHRFVSGLAFSFGLLIASSGMAQGIEPAPSAIVPLSATDGLGRTLPMPGEVLGPRPGRFVGMFYFLWHDNPRRQAAGRDGPYDIAKILARDPEAVHHPDSPLWGPIGHVSLLGRAALRLLLSAPTPG